MPIVSEPGEAQDDPELQAQVAAVIERVAGLHGCHDIEIRAVSAGYDVVLHCLADPDLPITEAHHLSELAESQLRAEVSGVAQVLVHIEPQSST
jgi:divalent metal cation (Fe/Co/Zn/Cd) transporter